MRNRLDDEDRRAVDLLLERANGLGDTPPVEQLFRAPVGNGFERRIDAAEMLLELLDNFPAEEPPQDLLSRTMERIHAAEAEPKAEAAIPPRATTPAERPHA